MKKISLIIALVLVLFVSSSAQANIDGKEIKDRDIEWSDFVGEVDQTSRFDAFTRWVTTYSFPPPKFKDGKAYVKLTVRLYLRSNSWVKPNKQSERLLNHERGHYKIGRICANEIEDTVNSTAFDRDDYAREINALYLEIARKCNEFERLYDQETNHYHNQEQQALWDEKLDELLNP
jgi:hypothetical protein